MSYSVYAYNVPKVSDDGLRALPVAPRETEAFGDLETARAFARERAGSFDRVVLIEAAAETQKMVERYVDGGLERADEVIRH
jgi:hypothetical protein